MTSKKVVTKKSMIFRIVFITVLIVSGALLNQFNVGTNELFGYSTVGNYLIFIGFVMVLVTTITYFTKREKIIDERMEMLRNKTMTLTFTFYTFAALSLSIWARIWPIR